MKTVSKTSSLPFNPERVTLGAVVWEDGPAPPGEPNGVVWFTPAKFAAPTTMPLLTAPEKVTVTVPETPSVGLSRL